MAQLAIRGHATRGKEVIEILEMLGGKNIHRHDGKSSEFVYVINSSYKGEIDCFYAVSDVYKVYTLEQFLEKFPYKVGDKVYHIIHNKEQIITNMVWGKQENEVIYQTDNDEYSFVNYLQPYKEETMEDKPNLLQQLKEYFDNTPRDVIEKEWHEYDKYNKIGPDVIEYLEYVNNIRQPKYPKTYIECAKILDCFSAAHIDGYKNELFEKLQELLICRDAYWKIAGEQLGLGKPWELDWGDKCQEKWFITTFNNTISCDFCNNHSYVIAKHNHILAFPTEEMRDAFYENFKELIEEVKELL